MPTPLHNVTDVMYNSLPWDLGKTVFPQVVLEVCGPHLRASDKESLQYALTGIQHVAHEAQYRADIQRIYDHLQQYIPAAVLSECEANIIARLQERYNEYSIPKK
jgi:hypothetical protein